MHIVLHEPEIPYNTGNIGRTCVAVNAVLHLIRPLGFHINDRSIKRAGLDYWNDLDVRYYADFQDFLCKNSLNSASSPRLFMATTKSPRLYTEAAYNPGDFIMFGKESGGIPECILSQYMNTLVRIPMLQDKRSLNLSNAVAIILFEALRQNNFTGLQFAGRFHS